MIQPATALGASQEVREPVPVGLRDSWRRCGICGAMVYDLGKLASDRLHRTPGVCRMVRCRTCGHRQLGRTLDAEQAREAYPAHYVVRSIFPRNASSFCGRLIHKSIACVEEARVKLLKHYLLLDERSRIFDASCGSGTFLEAVQRTSRAAGVGVEPDEPSVRRARQRNLEVYHGTLLDNELELAGFDAVTMWHVLEHTVEPVRELAAARQAVKPGGYVFVGVPDAGGFAARFFGSYWFGRDVPRHVHQFTAAEMVLVAERAGLQVRAVEHVTEFSTIAGSVHNLFGRRWCDDPGKHLLKWIALQAFFMPADFLVRWLGLGDYLVLVARRPGGDR